MEEKETNIWISDILYRYLRGEASGDEEIMIRCWLKNERNAAFFEQLSQSDLLFKGMKELQAVDTEKAFLKIRRQMLRQRRRYRFTWALRGIAALVCIVWTVFLLQRPLPVEESFFWVQEIPALPADCTILQTALGKVMYLGDTVLSVSPSLEKMMQNRLPDHLPERIAYNVLSTSRRRMIEVTLADSSKVWLNAGSVLRYPTVFTGDRRVVYLKGEAYFEVAKNIAQPFIVRTGPADIQVIGTCFNLNTDGENSCVTTLVEGCVKMVSPQHDEVTIQAGQQVSLNATGIKVNRVNTRYYMAWKNNCFAFQEKSLRQIAAALSEWYDCPIVFASEQLAELKYSTILYRYTELRKVLDILAHTGDFTFSEKGAEGFLIQEK